MKDFPTPRREQALDDLRREIRLADDGDRAFLYEVLNVVKVLLLVDETPRRKENSVQAAVE